MSYALDMPRSTSRLAAPAIAAVAVATVLVMIVQFGPIWLTKVPDWLTLPIADVVGKSLTWLVRDASIGGVRMLDVTRLFASLSDYLIKGTIVLLADGVSTGRGLNVTQVVPPLSWLAVGGAAVITAYRLNGVPLAGLTALSVAFLVCFGLWHNAMVTLASVLVSVLAAVALGLALGIWSYRSKTVEKFNRGLMNIMQTIPTFSYLVPTLLLFGYGPSAALAATIVYALPPMVHNTVLALQSVPTESIECGRMVGCTRRQLLWQVQLPTALAKLAVGLNQVIMMTLNMVIIASMIGAGGLGFDVLAALKKLDIGTGLQAGMGIVALAVVLDRMSQAAAHSAAHGKHREPGQWPPWRLVAVWMVFATLVALIFKPAQAWPENYVVSTAPFWNGLVSWINIQFYDALNSFRNFSLLHVMLPIRDAFAHAPWSLVVAFLGLIAYVIGGMRLAAYCTALALGIVVSGYWYPATNSVYLVSISVVAAVVIGFPIGIWLASRPKLHAAANFSLDTLQTLPSFIYLLPAVMLFSIGDMSAAIAIILYSIAPAIRYAMVGMSQVPQARLEAAQIAGCTKWQTLMWVRLPAAYPTLLVGINQTIMMAFSMLVIAALVGTKDLGERVLTALNNSLIGQGIVTGLCVAALALIADALLTAAANKASSPRRIQEH